MSNIFFADENGDSGDDGLGPLLTGAMNRTGLTYTASTRKLSGGDFSGYSPGQYDYLCVKTATGIATGLYMVESKDSGDLVLKTWGSYVYGDADYPPTIPGVLKAPVSDGTSISTATGPKDTMPNGIALMTPSAENDLHVTGTFTGKVTPNVLGTIANPNTVWGFGSYPGDGVRAILDATTSPDHGIYLDTDAVGLVLRALDVKNAPSTGIYQTANSDKILIDDGIVQSCGNGISLMTGATCVNTDVMNNTGVGITPASTPASPTVLLGCRVTGNGSHGIARGCVAICCLIAQNGGNGINNASGAVPLAVDRSTIDADGSAYGIFGGAQSTMVTDTIVIGAATHAIRRTTDCGNLSLIKNLLLHNNAADFQNCRCDSGLILADPLLDADHIPQAGSPALRAGMGGGNLGYNPATPLPVAGLMSGGMM